MNQNLLENKRYCLFDAFGTLFKTSDFQKNLEDIVGDKAVSLVSLWRRKQLEYTWLYNQMGRYIPFDQITSNALGYSMNYHQTYDPGILELLLPVYEKPILMDDVKSLLETLSSQNISMAILSNGTPGMLRAGVEKTGISNLFAALFSVDRIRTYKPNPLVYQMAVEGLHTTKDQCLFISGNQWDIAGASTYGIDSIWINRNKEPKDHLPFGKVIEIKNIMDLLKVSK